MSENNNGAATYTFQLKGISPMPVAPASCDATLEVVGPMTVEDAVRTAWALRITDERLGRYMARPPRHLDDGWPLITGAMLEKQLVYMAEEYSDVEGGVWKPVPFDELDYRTVDALLLMLAENVSTEDCEPNDWYHFPVNVEAMRRWLEKYGVKVEEVFRRTDALEV